MEIVGDESDPTWPTNIPPDKFYNPGSDISLKCIIRRLLIRNATVHDITNVSWKKDGIIINLQAQERLRQGFIYLLLLFIYHSFPIKSG